MNVTQQEARTKSGEKWNAPTNNCAVLYNKRQENEIESGSHAQFPLYQTTKANNHSSSSSSTTTNNNTI
jgi:hypothetical protein